MRRLLRPWCLFLWLMAGFALNILTTLWMAAQPEYRWPVGVAVRALPPAWPDRPPEDWPSPTAACRRDHWHCTVFAAYADFQPGRGYGSPQQFGRMMVVRRSGWPFGSLEWTGFCDARTFRWQDGFAESSSPWRDGCPLPEWLDGPSIDPLPIRLPTRPAWPGFALNTLAWTAIAFPLALAPTFAVRAVWRRGLGAIRLRRGRCPACGYPREGVAALRGLPCAECGHNAPRFRGSTDY